MMFNSKDRLVIKSVVEDGYRKSGEGKWEREVEISIDGWFTINEKFCNKGGSTNQRGLKKIFQEDLSRGRNANDNDCMMSSQFLISVLRSSKNI